LDGARQSQETTVEMLGKGVWRVQRPPDAPEGCGSVYYLDDAGESDFLCRLMHFFGFGVEFFNVGHDDIVDQR
jgi:hypothetical protein